MARDSRDTRVCPWWLIHTFDNPLRRLLQDPERILRGGVRPGDHCLDLGCGFGYFTVPMARIVGPAGTVTAADLQPEMLAGVKRRAEKAGLASHVRLHQVDASGVHFDGVFHFVLAFWMVHEVPDQRVVLGQVCRALVPGGRFLLVEPRGHEGTPLMEIDGEMVTVARDTLVPSTAGHLHSIRNESDSVARFLVVKPPNPRPERPPICDARAPAQSGCRRAAGDRVVGLRGSDEPGVPIHELHRNVRSHQPDCPRLACAGGFLRARVRLRSRSACVRPRGRRPGAGHWGPGRAASGCSPAPPRLRRRGADSGDLHVLDAGRAIARRRRSPGVWPHRLRRLRRAAARDEVLEAGGSSHGDIVSTQAGAKTVTWAYVRDPEGNLIELQSWSDAAP